MAVKKVAFGGPIVVKKAGTPKRIADPGLRVWEDEVYQGSGGGSGMGVWSRPDAHTVQYRLYCQVRGQDFTDGVLDPFEVPGDEDVRRDPGRG